MKKINDYLTLFSLWKNMACHHFWWYSNSIIIILLLCNIFIIVMRRLTIDDDYQVKKFVIYYPMIRVSMEFGFPMVNELFLFFALLIQRIQNFIEKFFYLITSNCHHHWQEKAKVDIKVHKNKWIHFEFWESWTSNERENDKLQNKPVSLTVCLFSPCDDNIMVVVI